MTEQGRGLGELGHQLQPGVAGPAVVELHLVRQAPRLTTALKKFFWEIIFRDNTGYCSLFFFNWEMIMDIILCTNNIKHAFIFQLNFQSSSENFTSKQV